MPRKPAAPEGGPAGPAAPAAQPGRSSESPAKLPASAAEAVTGLIGSGIHALKGVRDDMRARRSRVFAALLGIEPGQAEAGSTRADSTAETGPRHFDNVFDQRVAESLQRLGYPPPEVFAALVELLNALPKAQGLDAPDALPKAPAARRQSGPQARSSRVAKVAPEPKS